MKFLLVDTAFDSGIAAIFSDGKIIAECAIPLLGNQSRHLFPEIQKILEKSDIQPETLDFIAAGVGPGSYTGMRVGGIIGKCFAYTLKKPLVGVCSLEAFSPATEGAFTVMVDARISGAYILNGVKEKNRIIFDQTPQVLPIDKALELSTGQLVTLPGNRIKKRVGSRDWIEVEPSSEILGAQALSQYKRGVYSLDAKLDLLYLRPTQAELERKVS